ncbi:MAG: transporter substrate-binding domain-containing protein [Clostridiales bacterium]|nr:MAG: transporter substrate-binding domain-containing protein [Clostridiales bacterium]
MLTNTSRVLQMTSFFQANADGKDELHMATNAQFPPYEYYEGEKVVGIDAEMAAAIADKLDMKLVIDDMDFDAIITSVQQGKSDMGMAGMTVTEDRLKNINSRNRMQQVFSRLSFPREVKSLL